MPSTLRARVALLVLLGAFLIPIGLSSLRGLTHILVCREAEEAPFTIRIPEGGAPEITSSKRILPGERGLCGGLALDLRAGGGGAEGVRMIVAITNNTDTPWRGTVALELQGPRSTSLPVDIGAIAAGETEQDELVLRLPPGIHELQGSLLIGP